MVTAALEQLTATLRALEKPRPHGNRPVVAPDHHRDRLTGRGLPRSVEQLRGVPLVADGTHGAAGGGRVDDRFRVGNGTGDWLLQLNVQARFQGG